MIEKLNDTVTYVGCDDPDLKLFEGQYQVPNGMAYNSYFIDAPKTVIMDTVDHRKKDEWLENIKEVLNGREADYLIVQHLEPDHSGAVEEFCALYPHTRLVMSKKAASMAPNFFSEDLKDRIMEVKEGDELDLGDRKLHFITAPMVHWPEVIMSYDDKDKILYSADAFGKFGTRSADEPWDDEARRYFINIVGKYGPQVQAVLKKASGLDIQTLAPLHGPVLQEGLDHVLDLYNTWSSYRPEKEGIFIAAASAHGHTLQAALKMKEILEEKGQTVSFINLNKEDIHEAVARAYEYPKMILAANSYDAGVFPPMERFLTVLSHKNFQNRIIGIIQNGSWAPSAARTMKEILSKNKNLTYVEPEVLITTRMKDQDLDKMRELADHIIEA